MANCHCPYNTRVIMAGHEGCGTFALSECWLLNDLPLTVAFALLQAPKHDLEHM